MSKERTDYATLAKELGCHIRIGTYGIQFLPRNLGGKVYKLVNVVPLTGWITDAKEVERIMRERGLEL